MARLLITGLLSLSFALLLAGCNDPVSKSANLVQTKGIKASESTECESCTFEPSSPVALAGIQSGSNAFSAAFSISTLQSYNTSNPTAGLTWTYDTINNTFTASGNNTSLSGAFDQFGFLGSFSKDGATYTLGYNDWGNLMTVTKNTGSGANLYLSFVYSADGNSLVGYFNHELMEYFPVAQQSPPPPMSLASTNGMYSYEYNGKPVMTLVQAQDPCAYCSTLFENNMLAAGNIAGVCSTSVTAGFVACCIFTPAIPLCLVSYTVGIAACMATYKIQENTNWLNYQACLDFNNCEIDPVRKSKPHVEYNEGGFSDPPSN